MSFRFKPEHFTYLTCCEAFHPEEMAHQTNKLLDEHVKTLPEVFGDGDTPTCPQIWTTYERDRTQRHHARLWGVEEIKRERCIGHVPQYLCDKYGTAFHEAVCKDCGTRLVAEWREAE